LHGWMFVKVYGMCNMSRGRRRRGSLFSSQKGEKGIMFECVCVPRFSMKNRKLDCMEEYRRKSIATRITNSIDTRITNSIATRITKSMGTSITNRIALPITILSKQDV